MYKNILKLVGVTGILRILTYVFPDSDVCYKTALLQSLQLNKFGSKFFTSFLMSKNIGVDMNAKKRDIIRVKNDKNIKHFVVQQFMAHKLECMNEYKINAGGWLINMLLDIFQNFKNYIQAINYVNSSDLPVNCMANFPIEFIVIQTLNKTSWKFRHLIFFLKLSIIQPLHVTMFLSCVVQVLWLILVHKPKKRKSVIIIYYK